MLCVHDGVYQISQVLSFSWLNSLLFQNGMRAFRGQGQQTSGRSNRQQWVLARVPPAGGMTVTAMVLTMLSNRKGRQRV